MAHDYKNALADLVRALDRQHFSNMISAGKCRYSPNVEDALHRAKDVLREPPSPVDPADLVRGLDDPESQIGQDHIREMRELMDEAQMSEHTVSYGPIEFIPGEFREFAEMPSIFLFSPAQDLPIRRDPILARRRFERWYDEDGREMGRWTWEKLPL